MGLDVGIAPALTIPRHHEVAAVVHGHRGMLVIVAGRGIDEKLSTLHNSSGVIPLAIDAVDAAPCGSLAFPDDHEVAAGIHSDVRVVLIAGRGRIHLKI